MTDTDQSASGASERADLGLDVDGPADARSDGAMTAPAVTDPAARCGSGLKVIRGGSWRFGADSARCGLRYTHRPQDRGFSLGVRLAHDAERDLL